MFGFIRRQPFKGLAAIFCVLGIGWLALAFISFLYRHPTLRSQQAVKGTTFKLFWRAISRTICACGNEKLDSARDCRSIGKL